MKPLEKLTLHEFMQVFFLVVPMDATIASALNYAFLQYAQKVERNDSNLFLEIQEWVYGKNRDSYRKSLGSSEGFKEKFENWEDYGIEEWQPSISNNTIKNIRTKPDYEPRKYYCFDADCLNLLLNELPNCPESNVSRLLLTQDVIIEKISEGLKARGFDLSPYKVSSPNEEKETYNEKALYAEIAAAAAFSAANGPSSSTESIEADETDNGTVELPNPVAVIPATYRDLLKHGWTKTSIAEALVAGDYETYDIDAENEGTPSQWQEFLSGYPETFQYLVTEDFKEIAGNFSFVSITPEQANLAVKGLLYESDLSPDRTRDLFSPATDHILFLLNLSLRESFSETENHLLLRKMFFSQLLHYAENGIFFRSMIMSAHKKSEEAFLRAWGFEYVADHKKTGRIYVLNMIPFPRQLDEALKLYLGFDPIRKALKRLYSSFPVVNHIGNRDFSFFAFEDQDNNFEEYAATLTYISSEAEKVPSLTSLINGLPLNRGTAAALLKLTEETTDVDFLYELYSALFLRYQPLLTEEERYRLTRSATDQYGSSFLLERWGVQADNRFF